ncbi:MAG: GGDEF domain-containing protein [Actinomycetota bacterium]|nr:GGDEF domain-containing protein [Actinomycetota bacterium]
MGQINKFEELIEHMHFLEQLSVKVHGLKEEEDIYQLINDHFKAAGKYTVGLLMLTGEGDRLRIITSLDHGNIQKVEKLVGTRFSNYHIDLNKSTIYSQVVRDGRTIQTKSLDIIKELFPSPLARVATRALGLENNFPIITPVAVDGEIIGALSINSCHLASYLIPTVKNFALHISTAVKFVRERKKRMAAEKKLKDMAYYDGLTSLPNRTLFMDRAKIALRLAGRGRDMWQ